MKNESLYIKIEISVSDKQYFYNPVGTAEMRTEIAPENIDEKLSAALATAAAGLLMAAKSKYFVEKAEKESEEME